MADYILSRDPTPFLERHRRIPTRRGRAPDDAGAGGFDPGVGRHHAYPTATPPAAALPPADAPRRSAIAAAWPFGDAEWRGRHPRPDPDPEG